MRPAGSPEELERRRRRAMRLLDDGYAPVDEVPPVFRLPAGQLSQSHC